jgi:hypothetical protein
VSEIVPAFFIDDPEPRITQRLYNGRKIVVFEGKVRLSEITGWIDNPRIDLAKRLRLDQTGASQLTEDEVFDLMKSDPEVRLKELRDDIMKNGLREPLTISSTKKLLDGNRRYFALRYALETIKQGDPNRQDIENVPAYVLSATASADDEQNVLVEENFSASLKIEWPDYVKASMIIRAKEEGLEEVEICRKYSWPKSKVKETMRIHEVISDFEAFATAAVDPNDDHGGGLGLSEQEAQMLAAKNYQFFNEAQKSFLSPLRTDVDFKIQFFRWISEGKFASFPEVRIAYKAWQDPEARAAISRNEPTAAKAAKAIVDYSARAHQSGAEAAGRIESFVRFLREMTVDEFESIGPAAREHLRETLRLVIDMTDVAKKATP